MTNKLSPLSQYVRSLTPLTALAVAVEISFGATAAQALQFNFSPSSGTSQQAIDGFTAAGDLWSDLFTDNVTVNIDIGFESLGSGILGQASSNTIGNRYSNVRNALTNERVSADDFTAVANLPTGSFLDFLTTDPFSGNTIRDNNSSTNNYYLDINRANAKALGLLSGNNSSTDATIKFNSDFNFDFNPDNGISSNAFDFVGIAAHEIGHALGFVSGVDIVDYYSEPDGPGAPLSLDRYRIFSPLDLFRYSKNSANQGILDLAAGSKAYFSIDGGDTNLGLF
ncbi:MAG: NF038122 family metalloprotease, partial [Coleofasciculus sp.]